MENTEKAMRVLVCGAGENGALVIAQLRKNKAIEVVTLDPRDNPYALAEGIIDKIDVDESLTPLTIDYVIGKVNPDLILITTEPEDLGFGNVAGMEILSSSLRDELTSISSVPLIQVSRLKFR